MPFGMWDLLRLGIKPVSPVLYDGFLTTGPQSYYYSDPNILPTASAVVFWGLIQILQLEIAK